MNLSRERTNRLNALLDDWVPPRLRDGRLFTWVARRAYATSTIDITRFKERAPYLDDAEFARFYRELETTIDQGETDLTEGSLRAVVDAVVGDRVLDVACGQAFLTAHLGGDGTGRLAVGADVHVPRSARGRGARLVTADVERLPFADASFDTVVSTHTLEHVRHLPLALEELRRVARRRLVVVVPRQRPYRVTFNQHLHFFPYEWSLLAVTGTDRPHQLRQVDADWLYVEDQERG